MKKKRKQANKKNKKDSKACLEVPKPFKGLYFNRPLMILLTSFLIIILSFCLYVNYSTVSPPDIDNEVKEEPAGHDCTVNLDCSQPRCPGMKGLCENGFCVIRNIGSSSLRCVDLKMPVCGNNICEGDEKSRCPEDC